VIGRVIGGRYRILGRVAEGGMAAIYKARQDPLDRIVALKILAEALSEDPVQKVRFLREARAANKIRHENVIDVTDFGETEDGLVYLVMEYLDGESLADMLSRGPLIVSRAISILRPVCRGLSRAHDLGILHRDIKPENIFLEKRHEGGENVKILDFGLAQVVGDQRLTSTGQVFGTPEYLAPEQATAAELTPATDLYALGVVFYEMVTGRLPFGGSTARLIYQHIHDAPRLPSQVRVGVPPDIDEIVLRLLRKDPKARFASAREFEEALADWERRVEERELASRASTVRASTVDSFDFPVETLDAFQRRLDAARQQARAPARGDAGVDREVERFAQLLEQLRLAHATGNTAVKEYREYLQHGRTTLERLRRAVDELSRDEARTRREIEGLRTALGQARANVDGAGRDFARCRAQTAQVELGRDGAPTVAAAIAFETAGKAARRWRDTTAEAEAAERDLAAKGEEGEEIKFQIGQFRGRIAAYEVDLREAAGTGPAAGGESTVHRRRLDGVQQGYLRVLEQVARQAEKVERLLKPQGHQ
jgi:serine/threonine-protein kinase